MPVLFQYLHAQYIVEGAPASIGCAEDIQDTIGRKLEPPFEELFDEAEEYVLTILFDAWSQTLVADISSFDKV